TPNANGDLPFIKQDPNQPNQFYFTFVDEVIRAANAAGLVMGLLPTWGDKVGRTHGDGPQIFNVDNARNYGEFLGRQYKDRQIIWILGGDRLVDDMEKKNIWRALAAGLRSSSPHLITFHPKGGDASISSSSSVFAADDPTIDFNMQQNGHRDDTGSWERIQADYLSFPVKPVVDGEPLYEDHPIAFQPEARGYSNAHDIRRFMYWDLFAGAFGHTYGHHSIWQMHREGPGVNFPVMSWVEALDAPGASDVQHARALLESRPFLTRVPEGSFIIPSSAPHSVPGRGTKRMVATRDQDWSYAMIYLPASRQFSVRAGQLAGSKLHVWCFNPRDGFCIDLGQIPKPEVLEITPPEAGENLDWIMVLDDANRGFKPPGQPVGAISELKPGEPVTLEMRSHLLLTAR
ncbi:MAG: glycoside hydrolase family 140 protein, partial [Verrucomicrobia bacterium]|nr:glycoside hydrolase family 140 protein [Verrucomicrobiota bacterium]